MYPTPVLEKGTLCAGVMVEITPTFVKLMLSLRILLGKGFVTEKLL